MKSLISDTKIEICSKKNTETAIWYDENISGKLFSASFLSFSDSFFRFWVNDILSLFFNFFAREHLNVVIARALIVWEIARSSSRVSALNFLFDCLKVHKRLSRISPRSTGGPRKKVFSRITTTHKLTGDLIVENGEISSTRLIAHWVRSFPAFSLAPWSPSSPRLSISWSIRPPERCKISLIWATRSTSF